MFACSAPPTSRTAASIHREVAIAVKKKLSPKPQNPISSTGRRPKRSESAPRMGEPKKFAMPKEKVTTPYQKAWSACEPVKLPTSAGSTGMIRPIATMSISAVSMMKGIAAVRSLRAEKSLKRGCGSFTGAWGNGEGQDPDFKRSPPRARTFHRFAVDCALPYRRPCRRSRSSSSLRAESAQKSPFENPAETRTPHRGRPRRQRQPPAHERQGGHDFRGPLRRRRPLREGLQGSQPAQLPPERRLHRGPQGEEQPPLPRHGERQPLRAQGEGGSVAERRGGRPVPPRRRRRARSQTL